MGSKQNGKGLGKRVLGQGLVWLALVVLYAFLQPRVILTSDNVSMIHVVEGIWNGNRRLNGWVFGTNTFLFTDILPLIIGRALGIAYPFLIHTLPGMLLATFFVLAARLLFGSMPEKGQGRAAWLLCLAGGLLFLAVPRGLAAYPLLNLNSRNGLYPFILLCFACMMRWREGGKRRWLVAYTLLAFMATISDGAVLVLLFAPLVLYAGVLAIKKALQLKCDLPLAVCSAASYVGAKLVLLLLPRLHSFTTLGLPIAVEPPREWPGRLMENWRLLCDMAGFGRGAFVKPGLGQVFAAAGLVCLIGILVCLGYCAVRLFRLPAIEQLFFFVAVLNAASCVVTNVSFAHRYIVPFYLFGGMLLARRVYALSRWLAARLDVGWRRRVAAGAGVACVVVLTAGATATAADRLGMPVYGQEERAVVAWLEEKDVGAGGYGEFWASFIISFYAEESFPVYPVYVRDPGYLQPHDELHFVSWYAEEDKHFIIAYEGTDAISEQAMENLIGAPDETFHAGVYTVYWWDKDISVLMSWPGSD